MLHQKVNYLRRNKTIKTIRLIIQILLQLLFPDKQITIKQLKNSEEIAEAYDMFSKRYSNLIAYDGDVQKAMSNDPRHKKAVYFGIYKRGELLGTARILRELQYDYRLRPTSEPLSQLAELSMVSKKPGTSTHYLIMLLAFIAEYLRPKKVVKLTMMLNHYANNAGVLKPYNGLFRQIIPEPIDLIRFGQKAPSYVYDLDLTMYYHPRLSHGFIPYIICKGARALIKH